MEVAPSLHSDSELQTPVTKRLLQGHPLPAILVDPQHSGPRYPTFRPHQRRLSLQKGTAGAGGGGRDGGGASTPCAESGVSFSSPEGDPLPPSTTSKFSLRGVVPNPKLAATARARRKKTTRRQPPHPATSMGLNESQGTTGGTTVGTGARGVGVGGHLGVVSSTSSRISSGRTSEQVHGKAAAAAAAAAAQQKDSRMSHYGRALTSEGTEYFVNPEPVPFMPPNFMSSTMMKKIHIPKRHQDTFGGYEYNFTGQRGVMLHTDRYQVRKEYETLKSFEGLNQRDRLLAEMAYHEDLRSVRRRREMVPHRVQLDLFLGGRGLQYEERFDIKREIQRLKAMAMPVCARDLLHGKGIHLPPDHMSMMPRPSRGPVDSNSEEEVRISAAASMQRTVDHFNLDLHSPTLERHMSLTLGEVPHSRSVLRGKRQRLPTIGKTTSTPRGGAAAHDDAHSQASMPQTSRSAAWIEEQNQLLLRSQVDTPETTGSVTGRRTGTRLELEVYLPRGSCVDDHTDQDTESDTKLPEENRQLLSRPAAETTEEKHPGTAQQPPASQKKADLTTSTAVDPSSSPPPPPTGIAHTAGDGPRTGEEEEERSARVNQQQVSAGGVLSGSSAGRAGHHQVHIREDEAHLQSLEGRQTSPPVSHTPNPLKADLEMNVTEEQESSLRQMFQRLDTNRDGHLQYHQLKSQLPKEFSHQQENFVKQVYEITRSSGTFFGVDEFLMMTQLTNRVASLSGQAQEAYGKINFDTLEESIIKYVELFQQADSSQKGRIETDALRRLLGKSQDKATPDENSHVWSTVLDSVSLDYTSHVSRIEYLAHIPLFMALAPPSPQPHHPAPSQDHQ